MGMMTINEIMRLLPHRYPFLLIDRVLDHQPGKTLTAIKNVTFNEPYFLGHFPARPIMPGVLILEAMAQATGLLAFATREAGVAPEQATATDAPVYDADRAKQALYLFVSVDRARFKRQVEPGDQLLLAVRVLRVRRGMWRFSGEATVAGELAASAELMCAERELSG